MLLSFSPIASSIPCPQAPLIDASRRGTVRLGYSLRIPWVLERGFVFTHETVRGWEKRFAPLIAEQLRAKRRGQAGRSWYVDETYIKVHGKWCYLYRAIDQDGHLVDSLLSETHISYHTLFQD